MVSGEADATIMVLGLSSDTETSSLDLRVQVADQLAEGSRIKRLDFLVRTDSDVACIDTITRNSDRSVWHTFAIVHQPRSPLVNAIHD
jgi:hypothetical protein